MRRGFCLLVAGFLILLALVFWQARGWLFSADAEKLGDALAATGAVAKSWVISARTELPAGSMTEVETAELAVIEAMDRLGCGAGDYELRRIQDEYGFVVRAECVAGNVRIAAAARGIAHNDRARFAAGYLAVIVETGTAPGETAVWRDRAMAAATWGGAKPRISTCLVGWLGGKLENDEWLVRLDNAAKALGASGMEVVQGENFLSVTGYSPGLSDCIFFGEKSVNVNFAMRYNHCEHRTYVMIASPAIIGEY